MESLIGLNPKFTDKISKVKFRCTPETAILFTISVYLDLQNVVFNELSEVDIVMLQKEGILSRSYSNNSKLKCKINPFITQDSTVSVEDSKIHELRMVFKGTKRGAMGSSTTVKGKLERFLNTYNFDIEDIIRIAKKYVESFNGDYTYMKQLDYFIFKRDGKKSEETSTLLAWLEEEELEEQHPPERAEYGGKIL